MARKIRCNDEVIVLTGKDKGKRGTVQKVLPSGKAIVSGVGIVKKHQKPIPSSNQLGGVITRESPIDLSNIAIFNASLQKADRVGFVIRNGKKDRIFKSSGEIIK